MNGPVSLWSFFNEEEKPYVSYQIGEDAMIRQIMSAKKIQAQSWRLYFDNGSSTIFIVTKNVTYREWPNDEINPDLFVSFLRDNKVQVISR